MTDLNYSPRRFWAKVDKTPTCWNWTAARLRTGYGQFSVRDGGRKRVVTAHRVAYMEMNGPVPEGMILDHTCHNRACVNPGHLRIVTYKQNGENRGGCQVNSTSGVRGVAWIASRRRWRAQVQHNGQAKHVGYFQDLAKAEAAAVAARNELFTHNDLDRMATK